MKAVVFGAGRMGKPAAYDLTQNPNVESVLILDYSLELANALKNRLGSPKVIAEQTDASNIDSIATSIQGYDAMISCVPYYFNENLTRAAIQSKVHMVDLGGNNDVVKRQLALHKEAKEAGILITPDCGLAPGLVSVLTKALVDAGEDEIYLRVGGLPIIPKPPLGYALTFSVSGLINEYVEPVTVLMDGEIQVINPLEDLEEFQFKKLGIFEAFNTSGGISTLPETYQGKVDTLNYKTIRYPGHCAQIKLLRDLGLMSSDTIDGTKISPRSILEQLLLETLPKNKRDMILLKAEGKNITYQYVGYFDKATGFSAMQRMTTFPATALLSLIGTEEIKETGVLTQERYVNPERILEELEKRDIGIEKILK